jgi:hypothetical protein
MHSKQDAPLSRVPLHWLQPFLAPRAVGGRCRRLYSVYQMGARRLLVDAFRSGLLAGRSEHCGEWARSQVGIAGPTVDHCAHIMRGALH